jgi:molybdopterin/thiamine biosynthesis adenylyltransferase
VSRRPWWEHDGALEAEKAWFEADGLDFALDEKKLRDDGVVVFRGLLRLGTRRVAADVVYPPSYGAGGHPEVVAVELPVGRHRTSDGRLCLDHSVFGDSHPMDGATAVLRAERLWDLWENDRRQLEREEADAPDPAANHFAFRPEAAITLLDFDIAGCDRGYFRLHAAQLEPLRGVIDEVRVTHPHATTVSSTASAEALKGVHEINGAWIRVEEPPPQTVGELAPWLEEHHRAFRDSQFRYGKQQAEAAGRPDLPTVFAFVYPDEGPGRGERHDAWLFCVADVRTGTAYYARSFPLRAEERWLRQPQLEPLASRKLVIVGLGALGSQVADLLAKAGVGRFVLVDYDYITHGNRIRHQLGLRDLGLSKVRAMERRLLSVNPWCQVETYDCRVGAAYAGDYESLGPKLDEAVFKHVTSCDVLVNASAHSVTGRHLSGMAFDSRTVAVHAWVSAGAWGGRVLVQRPGQSGCWECLGRYQDEDRERDTTIVPQLAADPDVREISERGCADVTFTGPGFEIAAAAAATARIVVQALLQGTDKYPDAGFDLLTVRFRDERTALSSSTYSALRPHPNCSICQSNA